MSVQYVHYEVNMLLTYTLTSFFQPLLLESMLITSYHVTTVICLFTAQEKEKEKDKQKRRNIKSRKMFKSKCTIIQMSSVSPILFH